MHVWCHAHKFSIPLCICAGCGVHAGVATLHLGSKNAKQLTGPRLLLLAPAAEAERPSQVWLPGAEQQITHGARLRE